MLHVGIAQALPVYVGNVVATNAYAAPMTGGGTTSDPAAYLAAGSGGTASSLSQGSNGGSVESTAQSVGNTTVVNQAGARTTLSYRVDIVALDPSAPLNVSIPIRIVASGFTEGADLAGGTANRAYVDASVEFIVGLNNGQANLIDVQPGDANDYALHTFNVDQTFHFTPTDNFEVFLSAYAGAGAGGSTDPGYAHAFVDPTFTIDPAFASLYQLVGIPEMSAVTPPPAGTSVPEPSTGWLLLFGVVLLVSAGRGRTAARPLASSGVALLAGALSASAHRPSRVLT